MRKKDEKSYSTSISGVGIVERYVHFVKAIKGFPKPDKQAIIGYLEDCGDIISERTFFRIKSELEEGLGIKIGYDKNKGYFVQEESAEDLERLLHLSGLAMQEGQVKQALLNNPDLFEYVLFDPENAKQGDKNLATLLEALLKKQSVNMRYQKHTADESKHYLHLEPHYIKQYLGRWYVISYAPWLERPITLAVDERMQQVELEEHHFERKEGSFDRLHQVVGLNYSQGEIEFGISEPVEVVFEVSESYVAYLENLAIHHSQKCLKSLKNGNKLYAVEVIPNYELAQAFLRMGDQVKLLSPDFFVAYFKQIVMRIGERY